jgi:5-methylcytosine-specific restriction enzyme subunit McrC
MKDNDKHFTVFEHQSLWQHKGEQVLKTGQLKALQLFHSEKQFAEKGNVAFYDLVYNGVKFKEYVGVIQVGDLTIEVLPKADKYSKEEEKKEKETWQKILIGMLRAVGAFNIHAPSASALSVKSNFVLDLYFELFIKEIESLIHQGLIKKYRKQESNSLALKGSLKFAKHIQKNLVHQERFYVKHTIYDKTHQLHQILYKTLLLLKRINTNIQLNSRIGSLLLDFPEMKNITATAATFEKIVFNRKTAVYKNALEISKLLLLNYHPDLSNGNNNVLALMFDMNLLWEEFVCVSLRKHLKPEMKLESQAKKVFWQPQNGRESTMKPDILIETENGNIVLDTKWKNVGKGNPKPDDLRQLYVYHEYFNAKKVALVYPGNQGITKGKYYQKNKNEPDDKECAIIQIETYRVIADWQKIIAKNIFDWVDVY